MSYDINSGFGNIDWVKWFGKKDKEQAKAADQTEDGGSKDTKCTQNFDFKSAFEFFNSSSKPLDDSVLMVTISSLSERLNQSTIYDVDSFVEEMNFSSLSETVDIAQNKETLKSILKNIGNSYGNSSKFELSSSDFACFTMVSNIMFISGISDSKSRNKLSEIMSDSVLIRGRSISQILDDISNVLGTNKNNEYLEGMLKNVAELNPSGSTDSIARRDMWEFGKIALKNYSSRIQAQQDLENASASNESKLQTYSANIEMLNNQLISGGESQFTLSKIIRPVVSNTSSASQSNLSTDNTQSAQQAAVQSGQTKSKALPEGVDPNSPSAIYYTNYYSALPESQWDIASLEIINENTLIETDYKVWDAPKFQIVLDNDSNLVSKMQLTTLQASSLEMTDKQSIPNSRATVYDESTGNILGFAEYDSNGLKVKTLANDGTETTYVKSDEGILVTEKYSDGSWTEYSCDNAGVPNILSMYDSAGRLNKINYKVGSDFYSDIYQYDSQNRTSRISTYISTASETILTMYTAYTYKDDCVDILSVDSNGNSLYFAKTTLDGIMQEEILFGDEYSSYDIATITYMPDGETINTELLYDISPEGNRILLGGFLYDEETNQYNDVLTDEQGNIWICDNNSNVYYTFVDGKLKRLNLEPESTSSNNNNDGGDFSDASPETILDDIALDDDLVDDTQRDEAIENPDLVDDNSDTQNKEEQVNHYATSLNDVPQQAAPNSTITVIDSETGDELGSVEYDSDGNKSDVVIDPNSPAAKAYETFRSTNNFPDLTLIDNYHLSYTVKNSDNLNAFVTLNDKDEITSTKIYSESGSLLFESAQGKNILYSESMDDIINNPYYKHNGHLSVVVNPDTGVILGSYLHMGSSDRPFVNDISEYEYNEAGKLSKVISDKTVRSYGQNPHTINSVCTYSYLDDGSIIVNLDKTNNDIHTVSEYLLEFDGDLNKYTCFELDEDGTYIELDQIPSDIVIL